MKLYVKKIWSTHPNKYKFIEMNKALKEYNNWVKCNIIKFSQLKTFEEWLKTEI